MVRHADATNPRTSSPSSGRSRPASARAARPARVIGPGASECCRISRDDTCGTNEAELEHPRGCVSGLRAHARDDGADVRSFRQSCRLVEWKPPPLAQAFLVEVVVDAADAQAKHLDAARAPELHVLEYAERRWQQLPFDTRFFHGLGRRGLERRAAGIDEALRNAPAPVRAPPDEEYLHSARLTRAERDGGRLRDA